MSDLEARIAEVLAAHMDGKRTFAGVATDHEHLITVRCPCGWTEPNIPFLKVAPVIAWQAHVAEALAPVITSSNAKAWHAGRESVALDMIKPMGDDLQRPSTPNPYRSNDE